jgi:hypothetical protein
MRNPFRPESRIARQFWAALIARFTTPPRTGVLLHDPAASRAHNLDDPFFDPNVQKRVADIIADAARKDVAKTRAVPTEPPT